MNRLKAFVAELGERFTGFTLRERTLVTLGVLGCTWLLWQLTLGDAVLAQQVEVARTVEQLEVQLKNAAAEQQSLRLSRKADPNDALRAEQQTLKALLSELDSTLAGSLSRFVPPERMPAMLQDVLSAHPGLKLKLVKRLPSRSLLPTAEQDPELVPADGAAPPAADSANAAQANLYLHPLRIEFEGRYFDVLAYLQSLEEGPWRFNWRLLDFETEAYPGGRAVIEIETLSRDPRWLGV